MKTSRKVETWIALGQSLHRFVQQGVNSTLMTKTKRNIIKHIVPLLIILFSSQIVSAQTVTISRKNASLESIFLEISRQTGYNFFYDDNLIRKADKITIDVKNASIKEVLDLCLRQQPISYVVSDSSVRLQFKEIERDPTAGRTVTGKVTDMNGAILPGANIRVKGSNRGAVTDPEGNFELSGITPRTMLEVSYIGYETREIIVVNENNLFIRMDPGLKTLDEIITNGYRTTTRRDNLGTGAKITAEEISRQPINNPLAALQARVPGMIVIQRGGLPGTPFTVQIRGRRSVGSNPTQPPANSPLFIVDGVPFFNSHETMAQRSRITANSPFNTINPADIESIEVLKDANATSIYGSLGANGVVLITTKKAKPGKTTVNANFYTGIGKITRAPDYMDTKEYVQMRMEAFTNDGEVPDFGNAPDLKLWDTTRYINWKKLLIGNTARVHNAYVSLSGGSEQTRFLFGVGLNKETTVFPGDHGKSLTSVNLNVTHVSLNKKFEFSLATSYGYDKSELVSNDPTTAISTPPNAPEPKKEMGQLNWEENGFPFNNPFSYLQQPYTMKIERLTSGMRLNYKITPYLNLRTNAGYTLITGDETLALPISSQNPLFSPTGVASFGNSKNKNWIIEPQLEYSGNIGENSKLKAIIGTSFRERIAETEIQDGFGYTNDAVLHSIDGAATVQTESDFQQYKVVSAYGLVNYNLNGKYLAEVTARRDGSSRFGPERKFGNFASVAAGWIFSSERFVHRSLPFLTFGKLKASYGTTGNDQISDYSFLDAWMPTQFPYQNPSFRPSRLANSKYRWEQQQSLDLGTELGFHKNRIMFSLTWNLTRTTDQLISLTLPVQTGFNTIVKNYPAVVQNKNIEIELNTVNIRKNKFRWTSSLNLSIQRNKLLRFPHIESTSYFDKYVVGQPLNLAWGYRTAGMDPATGIYRFLDKKGFIVNLRDSLLAESDKTNLGTYEPSFFGGFQNTLELGNWQLYFLFQFVKQKGDHFIYYRSIIPGFQANQPVQLLDRWISPSIPATYSPYTQSPATTSFYSWTFLATSDQSFTDASFIRLKTISLSYYFPDKWIQKFRLNSARVYFQGQNLLTFTKFQGSDPETYANPLGLPPLKVFTVGLQVSL